MDDERQEREDELFKANLKKLEDDQKELDKLKDRSIAGENSPHPRPPDDLFPKDMTRQEMIEKATARTERQVAKEDAQELRDEEWRQSRIDHQKMVEEQQGQEAPQYEETEDVQQDDGFFARRRAKAQERKKKRGR